MKTSTIPIRALALGSFTTTTPGKDYLDELQLDLSTSSPDAKHLVRIAEELRTSNVPVAFPTETVYGLGADATRSAAVRGIYQAKQRPSDNPLIVHFASLEQIRRLLRGNSGVTDGADPIPAIYRPLIQKFWPGPLTILLPNPDNSALAPEVTAGLTTFGARIPRHPIALSLIQLANVPVAAPSANASTKPSPTAAEHVAYDLDGRITTIIDGGPCEVGVESTVVDGLSQPPMILRPGGISLEQIRQCVGWESVAVGYKDASEKESQPRAPGMKYRHYSPRAPVTLYTNKAAPPTLDDMVKLAHPSGVLGFIKTVHWNVTSNGLTTSMLADLESTRQSHRIIDSHDSAGSSGGFAGMLKSVNVELERRKIHKHVFEHSGKQLTVFVIDLGNDMTDIARGIFGALRDLDQKNVDAILVEGVGDTQDDLAAAVMNRLMKAAEVAI